MDTKEIRLLPPFSYFEQGNCYSGCKGGRFQFKVFANETLDAVVWMGEKCLKLTPENEIHARESFPMSPEGCAALAVWLQQQYESMKVD